MPVPLGDNRKKHIIMTSKRDIFSLSGPAHLTHINWDDPHHHRSVAACLVQGVYVLERDCQLNRMDTNALAGPWWESFDFKLVQPLIDDTDFSIFGAIYELRHSSFSQGLPSQTAPNAVIAFRGTITKSDSLSRDLELDLHLIRHGLHQTSRFQTAVEAVRKFAPVYSNNIWLCGHSLESAIALLAGKGIAEQGVFLETFLFNPPYVSAPIERITDRKLRTGLRIANSFITAGLAFAVKGSRHMSAANELFSALSSWAPCLFVNRADHICSEYIGYFEHRKHMDAIGAGKIGRLATQHSIGGLFLNAVGMESQPFHLIPSANMCINLGSAADYKQAHGIHQWWSSDLQLQFNQYRFSS